MQPMPRWQAFSRSKGGMNQPTRCWKANKPYDEFRYLPGSSDWCLQWFTYSVGR
jgi:hypothetical protein